MGYWKNYLIENGGIDRIRFEHMYVCADCFDDVGLKEFIRKNADNDSCDYCRATADDGIAVAVADLARHMERCLFREYEYAIDCLPWESRDGGYQGADHWDTRDFLSDELQLSLPNDDGDLFRDLCAALGDEPWCKRDPFQLEEHQMLALSWEMFCDIVKYRRRFLFWGESTDPDGELLRPGKMLRSLGEFCQNAKLTKILPAHSRLFRARAEKSGARFSSVTDLGPPPENIATSNRMSPAGIVMFYASEDAQTALRETARKPGRFVIAEFLTLVDALVLDLTTLPDIPSLFETDRTEHRQAQIFLRRFVTEFSKPLASDASEHIEYVPTQIVTEYFRSTFSIEGQPISGIRYPSAQHPGGSSLVLFADQSDFVSGSTSNPHGKCSETDQWLELVDVAKRVNITAAKIEKWQIAERVINFSDSMS